MFKYRLCPGRWLRISIDHKARCLKTNQDTEYFIYYQPTLAPWLDYHENKLKIELCLLKASTMILMLWILIYFYRYWYLDKSDMSGEFPRALAQFSFWCINFGDGDVMTFSAVSRTIVFALPIHSPTRCPSNESHLLLQTRFFLVTFLIANLSNTKVLLVARLLLLARVDPSTLLPAFSSTPCPMICHRRSWRPRSLCCGVMVHTGLEKILYASV